MCQDYAPLSTACVRALNDRLYEKRKAAALEIEKMVKDFVSVGNTSQIRKLLKVLGAEFAISQNPVRLEILLYLVFSPSISSSICGKAG